MNNIEIEFSSYSKNNTLLVNTAILTVKEVENNKTFELAFKQPVFKISPAELYDLQQNVYNQIEKITETDIKTVGDVKELGLTTKPGKGFDTLFNNTKAGLMSLDKKGQLTDKDKGLINNAFKLIEQLTGKK